MIAWHGHRATVGPPPHARRVTPSVRAGCYIVQPVPPSPVSGLHRSYQLRSALPAAALLLAVASPPAAAQLSQEDRAKNLLANGVIGGTVAGVRALVAGKREWRAVLAGFGGGVLTGVGKQVAAARFSGAGLIGRQVGAVGTSLIYSATADTAVLFAPIGPATLELRPRSADRVRMRLNAAQVLMLVHAAGQGRTHLDGDATLWAGTPVFRRPRTRMPVSENTNGFATPGAIFLARDELHPGDMRRTVLPHEMVHVVQWDALSYLVTLPVERAVVERLPGGRWLSRHVDIGLLGPLAVYTIAHHISYIHQPWEREAYLLTTGSSQPPPLDPGHYAPGHR